MTKLYKRYNLLIQLIILIVSYFFIINQVFWKQDLPALVKALETDLSSPDFLRTLVFVVLLMAVNWMLEAMKWQKLISKIEKVSLLQSVVAVLTGVTISSFTPNRVGEYFGRAFILKKASHIEGILITILGSMSQLLITFLTGSLAFLIFLPVFMPGAEFVRGYLYYSFMAVVVFFDLLLPGFLKRRSFPTAKMLPECCWNGCIPVHGVTPLKISWLCSCIHPAAALPRC